MNCVGHARKMLKITEKRNYISAIEGEKISQKKLVDIKQRVFIGTSSNQLF